MNALLLVLMLVAPQQTQAVAWASAEQGEAFAYGPSPQCGSGGFGSGKSWVYCLKALWLSDTFPGNRGVIARRVANELRDTTMATFFKLCPPSAYDPKLGGSWSASTKTLRLTNGSEILFRHFEDPNTQALLRGLEINWFFIDQAEEAPETMEEVFDILTGRLMRWDQATVPEWLIEHERAQGRAWQFLHPESKRPVPPPYAMLAVNPDIELHWVYRRFHPDSLERTRKKIPELNIETGQPTGRLLSYADLGYKMFDIPTLKNRFLSAENKQALLSKDEAFTRRYVFGKWGIPEGAIHVIPNESLIEGSPELLAYLRSSCTLHRFMDHGESSPTCCLWLAVDKNGNLFWYREYYLPNALISTHRQNITELSVGEHYGSNQADPSIFHRRQRPGAIKADNNKEHGGLWCVADDYSDVALLPKESAIYWTPADNNELGTRNRINEYLQVDPERVHPLTNLKGSPRMFFLKANDRYPQGLVHAIREIRSQRRMKVGSDLGRPIFSDERDPNVVDHSYDCLAGDTTVLTRSAGWQPVASLVGTVGDVWTLAGWQPYADCRRYRVNSPMVRVVTASSDLRCTPDHLVLTTNNGWKRAESLTNGDTIAECNQWSYRTPFRSSTASAITSAASTFSATANDFIAQCGSTITARCRRVATSIMSMATAPTTRLATSSCLTDASTSAGTASNRSTRRQSPPCRPRRRSGTEAQRAASGTERTSPRPSPIAGYATLKKTAPSVAERIWSHVAERLPATRAATIARALGFVGSIPVTTVVSSDPADSYCLSVPAPHAFAVNGGLLVHNCIRYGVASRPPSAREQGPKAEGGTFFGEQQRAIKSFRRQMARRA